MYGLPKDFDGTRLLGAFLEQICFGLYQVQLRFGERLTIAATSTFLYRDSPASEAKKIEIPDLPAVQSNLLQLLHHTIVNAYGNDEGTLTLEFDNSHVLQCLDDSKEYESYQIKYDDREIIV